MPASSASEAEDYFERNIRPLLAENCFACHGALTPQPQGGLRLDSREALLQGGKSGPAVVPGSPDDSRLLAMLRGTGGARMPPTGSLSDEQIARVAEWVRMGAPFPEHSEADQRGAGGDDGRHWSFVPPRATEPPPSKSGWADSPIDRFIEDGLWRQGLEPSPEAAPATLIRRLFLDLTGLPPAPGQVEAFLADQGDASYASLVDSLLASDRFGERWARHWLDVARYADDGAQARPFPIAWTYRDWVIDALNRDMPYDKFVLRQLAADLLGDGREHLAALGFLTIGLNLVRPTDVPENVDDRIDVISRGLLGLGVSCARCHDHKFDPIPQADYYSLYGILLNSPVSVDPVPIEEFDRSPASEFFEAKLGMRRQWLDTYREERLGDHVREFRRPEVLARYLEAGWQAREMTNRQVEDLSKEQDLNHYVLDRWRNYLAGLPVSALAAFGDLEQPGGAGRLALRMAEADSLYRWPDPQKEALRLALRGVGSPTDIPVEDFWWVQNEGDSNVMKTLKWQYHNVMFGWSMRGGPRHASVVHEPSTLLASHIFVRGNQHDKGREVPRQFLSALPGPGPFRSGSGRLELARAVASPDNPLTARVMVNRVWGHLFGEGIVRTPSDFGLRGDRPSHRHLLDFLAGGFVADKWSVKRLVRRIVLSKAYRQQSLETSVGVAKDAGNRLVWRQNRVRLGFEALRDSMLKVAGRLDPSSGGPPFQLQTVPSSGRRTVYAYVSRERPAALMRTFDFSNPEEHTPRRQVTTVPQQALFMMNAAFVAEQARAVAASCAAGPACIEEVHRRVLGRSPNKSEERAAAAFLAEVERSAPEDSKPSASRWAHGTAAIDPLTGTVGELQEFRYRSGEKLQASAMPASGHSGGASLTASGGYPGDSLDTAVTRRWTSPATMRISVKGALRHALGSQGRRFNHSNGVRGWLVSSRQGLLGTWVVRGVEARTDFTDIEVEAGEWLDFAVDSRGDYESDGFSWSPTIERMGNPPQVGAEDRVMAWTAAEGIPPHREAPLAPIEQYAQTLLMTNEFAFRD